MTTSLPQGNPPQGPTPILDIVLALGRIPCTSLVRTKALDALERQRADLERQEYDRWRREFPDDDDEGTPLGYDDGYDHDEQQQQQQSGTAAAAYAASSDVPLGEMSLVDFIRDLCVANGLTGPGAPLEDVDWEDLARFVDACRDWREPEPDAGPAEGAAVGTAAVSEEEEEEEKEEKEEKEDKAKEDKATDSQTGDNGEEKGAHGGGEERSATPYSCFSLSHRARLRLEQAGGHADGAHQPLTSFAGMGVLPPPDHRDSPPDQTADIPLIQIDTSSAAVCACSRPRATTSDDVPELVVTLPTPITARDVVDIPYQQA